jgi:transglutaminase-like putative cysteine protease
MERRDFLIATLASATAAALPHRVLASEAAPWRTFEITYDVELLAAGEPAHVWLPLPEDLGDYQRAGEIIWSGSAQKAALHRDPTYGAPMFHALFDGSGPRTLKVTTQVSTRERKVATHEVKEASIPRDVALYLKPTPTMPVDGIVASTAARITRGAHTPLAKSRAIYEWIVDNTFRDPKVKGCGRGDIRVMLETGYLGGKCADLNSLFVGLARASGVPAREVYGIRVADSAQFKSLGKSGDISKAQHCRAEFYLPGTGWVPVDPADVRKAVLEEKLSLSDAHVVALRERLFGYWEMNWMGLNTGRDFPLIPAARQALSFFMYPHGETPQNVTEDVDPATFRYRISSREV